jgi:hypothetical protein
VTLRINMWSSPRNLSTAMMYSWRERADTTVVDEPLYAHYLRTTGREHPGAAAVLRSQDADGARVVREVLDGAYPTPVVFFKQMAKHLVDLDRGFLTRCSNILLTRDPFDMLTSLQVQLPDATLADTGFPEMIEILEVLLAAGEEPVVVDSRHLLLDPRHVLGELCLRLGVDFDEAMLSWPVGPKPEDGVWATHWYDGVHRSTGWQPWTPKEATLLPALESVLDAATPLYERLLPYRIE